MILSVNSEIGTLQALLVHSPDSGLGKVVPSKAQDWLFEDIVHLDTLRENEYDLYLKLLLYFLDPDKVRGKLDEIDRPGNGRAFYKPDSPGFHGSANVIEFQRLLSDILTDPSLRRVVVSAVCAIEGSPFELQEKLNDTAPDALARIMISGSADDQEMLFAPVPNLIFTRDLGIVINDHLLLSKPAKKARSREALLARYVFFSHPLFAASRSRVLEIPPAFRYFLRPEEADEKVTLEGGDLMMVSPGHLLIGCSERTSASGANAAIRLLFDRRVVNKITVVSIPHKRDFMHIDTLFTQVKRNMWVVLGSIAANQPVIPWKHRDFLTEKKVKDQTQILRFEIDRDGPTRTFRCMEDLLDDISRNDFQCQEKTVFIYSGNNEFPYDAREQWTDSCNLLALREGVVLGYDRNDKTAEAFVREGFEVIPAAELLEKFERGLDPHQLRNTLILVPSAELSRARGGFHCMSLPLQRE